MAKEQIAVCIDVSTRRVRGEEKEVYTLSLENKEFEVWEGRYFKASLNDKFKPVINVIPMARIDKKSGQAYARMQPVVDWEKV